MAEREDSNPRYKSEALNGAVCVAYIQSTLGERIDRDAVVSGAHELVGFIRVSTHGVIKSYFSN
jgi:hypothetical protein